MTELKKPKSSEMCPPGYHIVHGHERICHSGTRTWVDTHRRRNRGRTQMLLQENLLYLYWNSKKKYSELNRIKGYKQDDGALDAIIQFWLDYWRSQGLKLPKIDPLLVKALIAVESTFSPKASAKIAGSSAYGLIQITDQTRRILSGVPNKDGYRELRSEYLELSRTDIEDPVVNIAAGTRWFFHKYATIPRKSQKNIFNTIRNYHSWDEEGKQYAKKIEDLYKRSK